MPHFARKRQFLTVPVIRLRAAGAGTALLAAAFLCTSAPALAQDTTYYQHIRPVLVENCLRCHSNAGLGWSMQDAEETFAKRRKIAQMILERQMPPWLAEDGHQEYLGNPMLKDYILKVVQGWRDGGYKKGAVRADPVVASATHASHAEAFRADLSLDVIPEGSYLPNPTRTDDYRCFVVDWTDKEAGFITGFRAEPGNRKVAHHFVVYSVTPQMADRFRELDNEEEGVGYQCFGGPLPDRIGSRAVRTEYEKKYPNGVRELNSSNFWLAHWAPGMDGHVFPDGTGIPMQPGSVLVVQLHYYNKDAPGERDEGSKLDFMVARSVDRPAFHLSQTNNEWLNGPRNNALAVPAGEMASVSLTEDLGDYQRYISAITGVPAAEIEAIEVHSANLHMHAIGHSGSISLERANGEKEVLLSVPRWDLGWQRDFTFVAPKVIPFEQLKGTKLSVSCTYKNPTEKTVYGGLGSDEEMCFNFSYLAVKRRK